MDSTAHTGRSRGDKMNLKEKRAKDQRSEKKKKEKKKKQKETHPESTVGDWGDTQKGGKMRMGSGRNFLKSCAEPCHRITIVQTRGGQKDHVTLWKRSGHDGLLGGGGTSHQKREGG